MTHWALVWKPSLFLCRILAHSLEILKILKLFCQKWQVAILMYGSAATSVALDSEILQLEGKLSQRGISSPLADATYTAKKHNRRLEILNQASSPILQSLCNYGPFFDRFGSLYLQSMSLHLQKLPRDVASHNHILITKNITTTRLKRQKKVHAQKS